MPELLHRSQQTPSRAQPRFRTRTPRRAKATSESITPPLNLRTLVHRPAFRSVDIPSAHSAKRRPSPCQASQSRSGRQTTPRVRSPPRLPGPSPACVAKLTVFPGVGVLYGKLQQGVIENRQVLTVARMRAEAEELYGSRLGDIGPGTDKIAGGFSRDDGASVRKVRPAPENPPRQTNPGHN